MKKILLLCVALSFLMFGCGGSDEGLLATSSVTATTDTLVLDSDIVTWVDAAGAKATYCAETSFTAIPVADSVNVAIKSTAYPTTGSITLPILIESATISYTPANTATPAMASEYQIVGTKIENGASATIPVRVASQEQKRALVNALACQPDKIYNYYTKISFKLKEIGSDKSVTADTSMQLRFSDYIDK